MSDELNKSPETGEQPEEEHYEGILGDYKEEDTAETAETPAEDAPAEDAPKEKKSGKKALAIVGICAAVLAVGGLGTFGVLQYRKTMPKVAASTEHAKMTDRMAACFVKDVLNMYVSYYGEDALKSNYSLDVNASLKDQAYPMEEGKTWFDTIIASVKNSAEQYLVFKEAGRAMGFEMSDEDLKEVEKKVAEADLSTYKNGVTEADLRASYELQAYGAALYKEIYNGFDFTDEEIEAYLDTNGNSYVTCGLMGFSISYDTAEETEETTDAEDETSEETTAEGETSEETAAEDETTEETAADETSSEEDTAAEDETSEKKGMDKATAEKLANALKAAKTADQFESQVSDILTEYEGYSDEELASLLPTISNDNFSYMTGNDLGDWAFGGTAKVGDTLLVEGDGVYYVYLMTREPSRDESPTINVRHILFSISDHVSAADPENPTDEENAAALEECRQLAQAALDEWNNGDKTEDSFAEIANRVSEDPGSNTNGGLYEGVTEGQMVQTFNDWCFDESRQVGDTGLVETSYGVHVMFFSGKGDPLWKTETVAAMRNEKFDEWYNEQAALYTVTINDDVFNSLEG